MVELRVVRHRNKDGKVYSVTIARDTQDNIDPWLGILNYVEANSIEEFLDILLDIQSKYGRILIKEYTR